MKMKFRSLLATILMAGSLLRPSFSEEVVANPDLGSEKTVAVVEESKGEQTEEKKFPLDLYSRTDYATKYLLRGLTLSEKPVVQPFINVGFKGFNIGGLFNYDIPTEKFNEADLFLEYKHAFEKLKLNASVGYALFSFSQAPFHRTQEIFGSVGVDVLTRPALRTYYDFEEGSGVYSELSLSHLHRFGLSENADVGISLEGRLGFNHDYFRDGTGLSHTELKLGLPIFLGDYVTLTPNINYHHALSKDFQNELYGGIALELTY